MLLRISLLVALCVSPLVAQVGPPPGVVESAEAAVNALGKQIVMGDYEAAVRLMYPRWKERLLKRLGSKEKLDEQLRSISETMVRNGISIIAVKVSGKTRVHEVRPTREQGGQESYQDWLLLVPTVTEMRIMERGSTKPTVLKSHGFQVAVSPKGEKLGWTFINGNDITVSDLRSLFPSLPANLQLPEVRREASE